MKNGLNEVHTKVKDAQETADNATQLAKQAQSAAATAQSTANSKLSSVKTINNVSLVGTGNLRLADLGIDTDIFIVCTELPKLADAKYGKVYLVKNTNIDPTGADTYVEYVKISDESQSPAADKWEKLGEWKPSVTVDSVLSSTSANPIQNRVVNENFEALNTKIGTEAAKCVKNEDIVTLTNDDIDTLWSQATAS